MGMGRPKAALILTREQREQLEGMVKSRSLPAGLVSRARIVLMSAAGKTNQEIARQLGMTNATVGKWRGRFLQQDVTGLHDELRPGRPRTVSDERVARLVRKTLETKPKDGTHWSVRQIAGEMRVGQVHGASHLARVRFGASSAAAFQALQRSLFRREGSGYRGVVSQPAGKRSSSVRG